MVSRGYLSLTVFSFARERGSGSKVIVSFQRQEGTTENLRDNVRYQELLSLDIASVTGSFVVPLGESDDLKLYKCISSDRGEVLTKESVTARDGIQ